METGPHRKLEQFWATHHDAGKSLRQWFTIASAAEWHKITDVRAQYPHADFVDGFTVFNIGGNKYRLITEILYEDQQIYIRHVLTHKEYDKGKWKG